jgi:CubicO group peptidase (beta-lactamase class C family)
MCPPGRRPLIVVACLALLLAGCAGDGVEQRIGRVENGLRVEQGDPPWRRLALADRMAHHNVPGVSIAVVNDFAIEWARGYGVLAAGAEQPVTSDTLFQGASIGKTVVAVAALSLVEQGKLDLDQPVNERLVSWKVPDNEFTARAKVTLRRLLSHSAGTIEHGYQGYARGQPRPALRQVLDGAPPANSPPVRVVALPGTAFAYSNGGFMVVQQLLMDVTGRPFASFVKETVFDPAGMRQSTFESPLPDRLTGLAAHGHRPDGPAVAGGWRTYPELGTGASFWTTPSDLARFGIEVMRAYAGQPNELLARDTAREMLTRQTPDGAGYGLGFGVSEEGGPRFHFSHDGGNEGYRSFFVMYPELGRGAVIMTSGHVGEKLWREIVNSISVEYELLSDYTLEATLVALGLIAVAVAAVLVRRRRRAPGQNTRER